MPASVNRAMNVLQTDASSGWDMLAFFDVSGDSGSPLSLNCLSGAVNCNIAQ